MLDLQVGNHIMLGRIFNLHLLYIKDLGYATKSGKVVTKVQ